MAHLTIYKDTAANTTAISNLFIDEYMKDANDAQLKVYLYLLRMMNAHLATSVSDIADKFNHTEKEVIRALKFWEKQQLLDLDYDGNKNLVGIHIRDLSSCSAAGTSPASETSATFVPTPIATTDALGRGIPSVAPAATSVATSVAAPVGTPVGSSVVSPVATLTPATAEPSPYAKPVYSADQLREFKNRQDTAQLLFIAESYIGKPLTPTEMKTILYFTDVLRFSEDLIDYLIQYCVERGKKDFKYIEKVAISWAEAGITTPKQAQKLSAKYDKSVYTIMNELGKNGSPTAKEMEFISRWTRDYGFSTDIIIEACERTVLATDRHRFEYAESILSSWKQQNVHHKSDILRIDDMYQQRRKAPAAPKQTANRFNQFTQNNYDFDALEQELLSN